MAAVTRLPDASASALGKHFEDVGTDFEAVLEEVRAGRPLVLADARTEVGYLYVAAEFASPEILNLMARQGRGIVCLCLTAGRCDQLGLSPIGPQDPGEVRTSLTVSIEARHGVSTGISVADRAQTIGVAISDNAGPEDLVVPGHVFPLRALEGGVLARASYVEAAVDLARLAGLKAAGVVCQVLSDDGADAGPAELSALAEDRGMSMVWIEDVVCARSNREQVVEQEGDQRTVETAMGTFTMVSFKEPFRERRHFALVKGDFAAVPEVPVWHQVEEASGDQHSFIELERAGRLARVLREIANRGAGVLLYSRTEADSALGSRGAEPLRRALVAQVMCGLGVGRFKLEDD